MTWFIIFDRPLCCNGAGCAWQKLALLQLCKHSVQANLTEVSLKNCFGKPGRAEWTLIWQPQKNQQIKSCQQPSIGLSGNSRPPAGFIQGLYPFGWRLHWHLLASSAALKERLEQSWRGAEPPQRKRWKESSCITSKWQRVLHGNKLHSNKGTRMVIWKRHN